MYIFDGETLEDLGWEKVKEDYLVLKTYDLTLEDLEMLNFEITYPPTEKMKDITMYPQYEE